MQLRRVDAEDAVLGAVARLDRVAVERDDLGVWAERLRLRHAIALDQDHDDHDEHERDQLAERLGKLARGLGASVSVSGVLRSVTAQSR